MPNPASQKPQFKNHRHRKNRKKSKRTETNPPQPLNDTADIPAIEEADSVEPEQPEGWNPTAWEYECRYNRVQEFITFWLEGVVAAEKGTKMKKMMEFYSRYDDYELDAYAWEIQNYGLCDPPEAGREIEHDSEWEAQFDGGWGDVVDDGWNPWKDEDEDQGAKEAVPTWSDRDDAWNASWVHPLARDEHLAAQGQALSDWPTDVGEAIWGPVAQAEQSPVEQMTPQSFATPPSSSYGEPVPRRNVANNASDITSPQTNPFIEFIVRRTRAGPNRASSLRKFYMMDTDEKIRMIQEVAHTIKRHTISSATS
ncbi:hypothetical protein K474DRAFT_389857 [Panus rudis PR-1116 ss-1]|nr:hypothetical protein K474DRAFT_389857 [Panus rudis PR-1116 ss-1]